MKKCRIIEWLPILIAIFILNPVSASEPEDNSQLTTHRGQAWYVDDDNVSGPWDGSFSNPFLTIQEGADSAQSGDTVFVMPGNYDGAWILAGGWDVHPGTDNIVVMGYGAPEDIVVAGTPMGMATFFIDGTYFEIKSMTITDGDINGILISSDSALIEDNIITANGNPSECSSFSGMGIFADASVQKITIRNNVISANGRSCDDGISGGGIYTEAAESYIIDNEISNNFALGAQSCYGGGLYCASGGTISGNVFRGNYTQGQFSYTHPVECYGGAAYLDNSGAATALYFENNTVFENLCEANGGYQHEVEGKGGGVYCQSGGSIYFENNLIVGNLCINYNIPADSVNLTLEGAGLYCESTISSIIANDIWNNTPQNYNSVIYPDPINYNISLDPVFCDPDSADFHIYSFSPCAPENSGNGELIGALGVGCTTNIVITVTNLNSSGTGSLAWAIDSANSHPVPNIIEFAVSGAISQPLGLPNLTDPAGTFINGSSAPGKAPSVIVNGGGSLSTGLEINSPNNTIEGLDIREYFVGLSISGSGSSYNIIKNNSISDCDVAGITVISSANFNTIGGYNSNESNTIINNLVGIAITTDSIYFVGNQIGAEGQGNTYDGINLSGSNYCLIDSNTICYNGEGVVLVNGGSRNTITRNEIYQNNDLGIDLNDDGVTANDFPDIDTGPNDLLNYPEIDDIVSNPNGSFTVSGTSSLYHKIEFFVAHPAGDSARPADPSGHGEACTYIGYTDCDFLGNFSYVIPASVGHLSQITMTATNMSGNTSEFSENFTLIPGPLIIVGYSTPNSISLWVTDPEGYYIGRDSNDVLYQTLFPATYTEALNDSIHIPNPKIGTYTIDVFAETGATAKTTYDVGIRIDGSDESMMVVDRDIPSEKAVHSYIYEVEEKWHYFNGDANRDETINIFDITYIISYLYLSGPAPWPVNSADADCNLIVNIFDITYLITYLYLSGEEPCYLEE